MAKASVRSSVRLPRPAALSKGRKLESRDLYCQLRKRVYFRIRKAILKVYCRPNFRRSLPESVSSSLPWSENSEYRRYFS